MNKRTHNEKLNETLTNKATYKEKSRNEPPTKKAATNKNKEQRMNSYHLFIEGLLVKVGNEVLIPLPVDEKLLLDALKNSVAVTKEKFSEELRIYGTIRRKDLLRYIDAPPNLIEDIIERKQETLVKFVKENSVYFALKEPYYNWGLLHLCALGGWSRSLEYATTIEHVSVLTGSDTSNLLCAAAMGGHASIIPLVVSNVNWGFYPTAFKTAESYGHAQFLATVVGIYKRHIERDPIKANSSYDRFSGRRQPSSQDIVQYTGFPSLRSICIHVVASEAIRHTTSLSNRLLSLPVLLLELVANVIARSPNGYRTLAQLKHETPDLGRLIPTSAWVESIGTAEQKIRQFTYHEYIATHKDSELHLIDIFAQANTFVIEPVDEYEASLTKFLPSEREVGVPSIVNKDTFLQQFKSFTGGFFEGFDFSNVVIIGGSVVGSLMPTPFISKIQYPADDSNSQIPLHYQNLKPKEDSPFSGSDIDIYIYGLDVKQFIRKVTQIYEHLAKFSKAHIQVLKSSQSIVFAAHYPFRHVQIVLTKFRHISHILTGVDIDCSAIAYDGVTLWASPRARMAWNRRWTLTDPNLFQIRGCPQYENRLVKYARRGFTIVDRSFHLYNKKNWEIPEYDLPPYNTIIAGAALLSAMVENPNIQRAMDVVASRNGLPYGPSVTEQEVAAFLREVGEISDTGYGPDDTCLVEQEYDCINDIKLLDERPFSVAPWYSKLDPKPVTK